MSYWRFLTAGNAGTNRPCQGDFSTASRPSFAGRITRRRTLPHFGRVFGGRPSELQLIQDALDQIEIADKLGFTNLWEVEHHFLEEYSHSSAPEVFLAVASQRTTNMRLGHGIVLTAPGYNHPARTPEPIAMLDLVSKGRVGFGSGESGSLAELGDFNLPPALKREMWREGLETALRCMTEVPFGGVEAST